MNGMKTIIEQVNNRLNTLDYNITYHESLNDYLTELKEFYEFDDDRMELEEFKISELLEQEKLSVDKPFIRVECFHAYSGEEVQIVKDLSVDAVLGKINPELLKESI